MLLDWNSSCSSIATQMCASVRCSREILLTSLGMIPMSCCCTNRFSLLAYCIL